MTYEERTTNREESGVAATDEEAERARAVVAPPDAVEADRDGLTAMERCPHCDGLGGFHAKRDCPGAAPQPDAEATAGETLGHWQSAFRDHFGPEGDDLAIADKGVQDLVAELNMARADVTKAQDERDALRTALDRLQRAYHALQRSHAPVSPVACDEGECGTARAALEVPK